MNDSLLDQVDCSAAEPEKPWSDRQKAVFDHAKNPDQDLLIQAVAGSGKTTTIIKAMDFAPGSSLFMAFNKAIAQDIREKATSGEVKTLNALGHGLIAANRGGELNARKSQDLVKKVMKDSDEAREWAYSLGRIVGLGKNLGLGITEAPEASDFQEIIDAYAPDIPFDRIQDFSFICREAFELSRLDTQTFDFDDQLWVPVAEGWGFPRFDNCFVDECQDLSPIQHLMLERLKAKGARLVAVGDRHQAIYGFRGASHDSMDLLKGKFDMLELPLDISYRCPESVVQEAQQFCPDIKWRDGAAKGEVKWLSSNPQDFSPFMVICRNNAPLFKEILWCVRNKKPCQVMSSFLDSFQGFVRGFKTQWTSDLRVKLDRWFEKEKEACERLGKRGKLAGLVDKYETTKLLAAEFKRTEDVLNLVKSLGYSKRGPIFATIHKSKGLEHEHIFILRPDCLGGWGDLTQAQKQQEDNLHYVAITRAQQTLTYGASPRR